jgi:hypothetical protein
LPLGSLLLTTAHRHQFNSLADLTNFFLEDAANFATLGNAKLVVSRWDNWLQIMYGRFREQENLSAGLKFFELDTSPANLGDVPVGALRIRDNINFSNLNESTGIKHLLWCGAGSTRHNKGIFFFLIQS